MGVIGVKFGDYHSYDDWKLKLKEIEIGSPGAKLVEIDVMGMDGVLDLTEAVTGSVRYGKRTLRFVFDARNCGYRKWADLISEISNKIHGKKVRIVLDCDNEYYYEGRCTVDTSKINDITSEFVITCECYPYKTAVASENGDWLWDPFSFVNGVIHKKYGFTIDSPSQWVGKEIIGYPVSYGVSFTCSSAMDVKFNNVVYSLPAGSTMLEEIELSDGTNTVYFRGTGTVDVLAKGGSL